MDKHKLSHLNDRGEAHMVDVGGKDVTHRTAIAAGTLHTSVQTLQLIASGTNKKGDVLATARIAGIMAAKRTAELIPLCHSLPLDKVTLDITPDEALPGLHVHAEVSMSGRTGVEMEALTAVSIACLTLYDMLKAADKGMVISDIRLLEKHGGRSGSFVAKL